jgi:hypothetical protein
MRRGEPVKPCPADRKQSGGEKVLVTVDSPTSREFSAKLSRLHQNDPELLLVGGLSEVVNPLSISYHIRECKSWFAFSSVGGL